MRITLPYPVFADEGVLERLFGEGEEEALVVPRCESCDAVPDGDLTHPSSFDLEEFACEVDVFGVVRA